jgi:hypothetical protein
MTTKEPFNNSPLKDAYETGRAQAINEFKEKLGKHIKINGNLSSRIVETEDGDFEHKHDFVLNNIVLELIEETAQEMTK